MEKEDYPIISAIFRYSFYPAMLAITLSLSFLLVFLFDERQFIFIPGVLLLVCIPVFMIAEWLHPYRTDWQSNHGDTGTDLLQTFLVLPSASKLAEYLLPILFYYPVVWITGPPQMDGILAEMNLVPAFLIALLAGEFCYYWFHRWCHVFPPAWRFHAVHHGAKRVYWINSGRFHFLEALISSMVYFLPLVLLGATPEVTILVIAFSSVTGFMEHVNVDFRAGVLNYFFNTAELHRWHHSIVIRESNRNYGKALSIWDLVFGTFYQPKGQAVDTVGIDEPAIPDSFVGQVMYPFRKKQSG